MRVKERAVLRYSLPSQKMRYRVGTSEETIERQDYPSPPPSYDMSRRHIIAPPEYHDALQDVLLESGNSSNTGQTGGSPSLLSLLSLDVIFNVFQAADSLHGQTLQ